MATELTAGEVAAAVASNLKSDVCAVYDDYKTRLRQWAARKTADGEADEIAAKDYQAQQTALKTAVTHMHLLLKVARELEADEARRGDAEDQAAWEAEADANLALPEP